MILWGVLLLIGSKRSFGCSHYPYLGFSSSRCTSVGVCMLVMEFHHGTDGDAEGRQRIALRNSIISDDGAVL